MSGGDDLLFLLAAIQSLSLTCGLLLDSLGEIVRVLASRGLVGTPASPFRKALEELVRMGIVEGSIEMRLLVGGGSALELVERWDSPSSMKRLLRCPSGSGPVVGVVGDSVGDNPGVGRLYGSGIVAVCAVLMAGMQCWRPEVYGSLVEWYGGFLSRLKALW